MIERVEGDFPDGGTWATKLYLDANWKDCAREEAVHIIMTIYDANDAGHSSYATTRRYIDLAGVRFREEADRLENRLWGASGTKMGYQNPGSLPAEEAAEAAIPLELGGGAGI